VKQLAMVRENLDSLPAVVLPTGYSIRHFLPGDEQLWEDILNQAFGESDAPRSFHDMMATDAACSPERILFVTWNDIPVATASAWYIPKWGTDTGYVHWVATRPDHTGKKLGYWVSLAVLHRFVFEGRKRAMLRTDDHRVPAIKTYLQLGFIPYLVEDDQRQRWRTIIEANSFQAFCPSLDDIIAGQCHGEAQPL